MVPVRPRETRSLGRALESLDRLVIRESEPVVRTGERTILLFGLLPGFAKARGHGSLAALASVLKDRLGLLLEFPRAERHGHFDLRGIPRGVDTAVEPHAAITVPGLVRDGQRRTADQIITHGCDR